MLCDDRMNLLNYFFFIFPIGCSDQRASNTIAYYSGNHAPMKVSLEQNIKNIYISMSVEILLYIYIQ